MKSMKFESNTKGKFNKIVDGTIFDTPLTFVTELFQNAYRAEATSLEITRNNDVLIFHDNGEGLKNIKSLMTFDYSSWKSTNEGFGIGFWSILGIPDLEYVRIRSNKFLIYVNMETAKVDLDFEMSDTEENFQGFSVELKSRFIEENESDIKDRIKSEGERMNYTICLNGEIVPQRDIFKDVSGDFVKRYSNKYFDAVLAVNTKSYENPMVIYEMRDVRELYNHGYIKGIISLNKNQKTKRTLIDLKEPDRVAIVYNNRYYKFIDKVNECVRDLYTSFLGEMIGEEVLNKYADAILMHLKTKDYEKFLLVDNESEKTKAINKIKTFFNVSAKSINDINASEVINTLSKLVGKNENWVLKASNEEASDNIMRITPNNIDNIVSDIAGVDDVQIGNQIFKKVEIGTESNNKDTDIEDENEVEDESETENESKIEIENENEIILYERNPKVVDEADYTGSYSIPIVKSEPKNNRQTLKEMIKKNKNIMWVEMNNSDSFAESIALAEYYNIKVLKAKNKLFETILKENEVPHIRDIDSAIFKNYAITEMAYKTTKEEAFIAMLEPVREHYNLQRGVFKIGNISEKITITLNGKNLKNENIKNTAKKISVYAVKYGNEVIFDRKATNLKKFNISLSDTKQAIGKNELKCIMYHLNTIAHELAHLLYGTVDNTENHRRYERILEEEIIEVYLKL